MFGDYGHISLIGDGLDEHFWREFLAHSAKVRHTQGPAEVVKR